MTLYWTFQQHKNFMPKVNRSGQAKVLSKVEMSKIMRSFQSPSHKLIFAICRYTAERISAVLKLETLDVFDVKGKVRPVITFKGANRKGYKNKPGKTRQIHLHPALKELLEAYEIPVGSKWLFPSRDNPLNHLARQSADEALRRACSHAGLGDAGISTHSFRRTAITELDKSGVSIRVIQEVTGHRNIGQLKTYIEVSEAQVTEAIKLL
ncbi:tyrosine-type recombinase/integrase [Allocoleopsis franciscana]|uniref:Site-specific recombinase XerD n=1 Tax=Allocoleopsis franciscana PCC 7113 TaxID=1173027 RepID=K9WPP6_9CYAN|nr:site-specific integrase [Allocoleopsis franciscana]AFZ22365.1 site-specific recombinase XerD [Allocoleopsis franciscana PCC 7113]